MSNQNDTVTETATEDTEQTRGRVGRPRSFKEETVAFGVGIPSRTRDQIRELAADKGERLNQAVERIVLTAHKQLIARQTKRSAKSAD